ncbi:MAG: alpha/beta fold hydrolase, partial [Halopseudomonas sp.]
MQPLISRQIPKPVAQMLHGDFEQDFRVWSQTLGGRTIAGYHSKAPEPNQWQICWLHGNGFNSLAYAPILRALTKSAQDGPGYSVFTTDIPGHGLSHPPERSWPSWRSMAKHVDQAMEQQFAGSPACKRVGIGHSLGSVLTLLQAHQNPHRFEKILLLDPMLFPPSIIALQQTIKTLKLWPWAPLPKSARQRQHRWESTESMQQQLASKGFYRGWHPDALKGYVGGGHRTTDQGVELSCAPEWEAKIFASYPSRLVQA